MRGSRLAAFVVVLFAIAFAGFARADDRPSLHASADTDVIGLGDVLHVTLEATSPGSSPVDPQLGKPGGFDIVNLSSSSSTSMSIMGGGAMSSQRGLTTVWSLRATKVGVFTIGPMTVRVDNVRYRSDPISVRVVPAGQAPQRLQTRQAPDPFDPFGGLFGQLNQQLGRQLGQPEPEALPLDKNLALPAPRGQRAFLHAAIDKTNVVVGEQVTYTVYLYADASLQSGTELSDLREPPASDFVRRSLQADPTKLEQVGLARVGDGVYTVQLLSRTALFPLKAGDLDIGETSIQIGARNGVRRTEDHHVHVTEPPVQGRPPGYATGDVGKFALSIDAFDHEAEQDGALGVTVVVSGQGNLPASLTPPERPEVEWLEPQITEKTGREAGDRFGGSRTFQYVVRVHRAGEVDLGDFTLPYWDPHASSYATARVALGTVQVKPSATPQPEAHAVNDALPGLPGARTSREPMAAPRRHATDTPAFWLGLGGMPLAYGLVVVAAGAVRRANEKRAARSASPRTEMENRVRAAEEASRADDASAIDAATARAIQAATIAGKGINVRGLATSDVARALREGGIADEDARDIEAVLLACEASRFSASESGSAGEARERWTRARQAILHIAGRA